VDNFQKNFAPTRASQKLSTGYPQVIHRLSTVFFKIPELEFRFQTTREGEKKFRIIPEFCKKKLPIGLRFIKDLQSSELLKIKE